MTCLPEDANSNNRERKKRKDSGASLNNILDRGYSYLLFFFIWTLYFCCACLRFSVSSRLETLPRHAVDAEAQRGEIIRNYLALSRVGDASPARVNYPSQGRKIAGCKLGNGASTGIRGN